MNKSILTTCMAVAISLNAAAQLNLIPKPVKAELTNGRFKLASTTAIIAPKMLASEAAFLQRQLNAAAGYSISIKKKPTQASSICLAITDSKEIKSEGYILNVTPTKVTIEGQTSTGVFYGIQTLLQLFPDAVYSNRPVANVSWEIPCVSITDYPRFKHRGMMLDLSRQYFDTAYVKRYIDWLAAHKMNILHMHLTDDEGWRIEIKKYPILTEKGAWRGENELLKPCHGSGKERYGGFYTQKQLKEIVEYAAKRKVEIIPEIDMPGHCKAVTECFPTSYCNAIDSTLSATNFYRNVICPSKDENYELVENIIKEVAEIFPSKYLHIGGDEVTMNAWKKCPICQAKMQQQGYTEVRQLHEMFNTRVDAILKKYGKQTLGWEEIIDKSSMPTTTTIVAWQGIKPGIEAAKRGYNVIFAPAQNLYLDMKQSLMERGHAWAKITPIEDVYAFEPFADTSFTDKEKANILGLQGTLFAEYLNAPAHFAEYQSFPRVSALSEIAWTPQHEKSFEDFSNRLVAKHIYRLQHMGIHFRVTPPTVTYNGKTLTASSNIARGVIRYSKYTNPTVNSPIYDKPIEASHPDDYIFSTFLGDSLVSHPVFILPKAAASWNPTNLKAGQFVQLEANITPAIAGNGCWVAMFMYVKGSRAEVKDVELYENGNCIATDNHTGYVRANFDNVVFQIHVSNYNPANTYTLKYKIKGASLYGDILIMQRK